MITAWIDLPSGYSLTIDDGTIRARNAKGKDLKSVPAAVKKTDEFLELDGLLTWLATHEAECRSQVERWLLRSLPVPTAVLAAVWPDPSWQAALTDLVVRSADDPEGELGFLRAASVADDGSPSVGIVDLDGESVTLGAAEVGIPHPALLPDLDDLREFAAELGIEQAFNQLQREVHPLPDPLPGPEVTALHDWSGGQFDQLRFAIGRATGAGFAVKGGYAVARIHEAGQLVEASYWIGADYPEAETWTEDLTWMVDGRAIPVREVGPVAYSEGVRMARHIHAGRKVEEDNK